MPSTSGASSLLIPLRRAYLTAFWLVAVAGVAAAAALAAAVSGSERPWAWGAGAGALMVLPRAVLPAWFETAVRAWNAGVRLTAGGLRRYVLWVSYHTIFAALGMAGAAAGVDKPPAGRSGWMPPGGDLRDPLDPRRSPPAPLRGQHDLRAYARGPAHARWALVLVPIGWLLNVLRDERQDSVPPSSTYTLY